MITRRHLLAALPVPFVAPIALASDRSQDFGYPSDSRIPVQFRGLFEHVQVRNFKDAIFEKAGGWPAFWVHGDTVKGEWYHNVVSASAMRAVSVDMYQWGEVLPQMLSEVLLEETARYLVGEGFYSVCPGRPWDARSFGPTYTCRKDPSLGKASGITLVSKGPFGHYLTDDKGNQGLVVWSERVYVKS